MAATGQPALPRDTVEATRQRRPVLGAALVLGAASLWATFGIFARHLYAAGFQPLELASVRSSIGLFVVAVYAVPRLLRPGNSMRVGWRALPFFAGYGVLGYATFVLVYLGAIERTTVSIAAALLYTAPAFVLLFSALLWRERVTARSMAVLLIVLAGVVLVTGAAGALVRGTASLGSAALLFGIGAGVTYASYTVFSKVATERYGPAAALFWMFAAAALTLGVLSPPHGPFVRAPEHAPMLIGLGIVPTVIPSALFLAALRELRASTASMLATAEPVVATLLAAALLHERIDVLQGIGIVLVVAAAVLLSQNATADSR